MTVAGYLQWFVVVPNLFADRNFTTLGLSQDSKVEKTTTQTLLPATTELSPGDTSVVKQSPQLPKPKRVRPVRAYDNRGRTPLERALWSNSTGASS